MSIKFKYEDCRHYLALVLKNDPELKDRVLRLFNTYWRVMSDAERRDLMNMVLENAALNQAEKTIKYLLQRMSHLSQEYGKDVRQ